jgi:hypothetical protein
MKVEIKVNDTPNPEVTADELDEVVREALQVSIEMDDGLDEVREALKALSRCLSEYEWKDDDQGRGFFVSVLPGRVGDNFELSMLERIHELDKWLERESAERRDVS